MIKQSPQLISIIVPVYNEAANLLPFCKAVASCIDRMAYRFELIFVNDGSRDKSVAILRRLASRYKQIKIVDLARNFGKEVAVSAGLHRAKGDAAIILDADLQHPPSLIPEFVKAWEEGSHVVVGVRQYSKKEGLFKRFTSHAFYKVFGAISSTQVTPNSTDYRLIDRCVIDAFNRFTERNRLTRGLIDWLGFVRSYIHFEAPERANGEASYGFVKRIHLAMDSLTAYSLLPLKLAGYLGVVILLVAGSLGVFVYFEKYIFHDPYGLNITGTALLALVLLFFVGLILACLGLVALYIARIHEEVINRPLYVVKPSPIMQDEEQV